MSHGAVVNTEPEVAITPLMVRDFIATYDCHDPIDRQIRKWLLERLYSEMYWRERELYPEWVDVGGEA